MEWTHSEGNISRWALFKNHYHKYEVGCCKYNQTPGNGQPGHYILLLLVCPPISDSRISLLSQPDMRELQNYVASTIPNRWRSFGYQLGIPHNKLDTIELSQSSFQSRFMAVLHEWEKGGVQIEFTWNKVIEVLLSQAINEYALANEIINLKQSSRLSL